MNNSNLKDAVINYTIDMCANNIKVAGIIAILADNDMVSISKIMDKTKINNHMAIQELLNQYEYSDDQRSIIFSTLEYECRTAYILVENYYDNYKRR